MVDTAETIGGGPAGATVARGRIRTEVRVPAYQRMHADRPPERVELGDRQPAPHAVRTHGLWFDVPASALGGVPDGEVPAALRSAGEALRVAAAVMCQTDTVDVGLQIQMERAPVRIILSEIEEGGNGLTTTIFSDLPGLLRRALRRLENCPNCAEDTGSRGCPKCVTADRGHARSVFRAGGITVLRHLSTDLVD